MPSAPASSTCFAKCAKAVKGGAGAHVARRVIQMQLERVGAGILKQSGVLEPAARRRSVERRHHRHADGALHAPQVLEVFVRPDRHPDRRLEAPRLGERIGVGVDVLDRVELFAGDLFLEQRAQHEHRRAGVLERAHQIEIVAERAGADDERMRQPHPEIGGAEIHYVSM